MTIDPTKTAIACGGTGFKAAFVHGVLSALETHGFTAAAYAGSSGAALPAMRASVGEAYSSGVATWLRGLAMFGVQGTGMSDILLTDIAGVSQSVVPKMIVGSTPRLCIATSAVHTIAGAIETQGTRAGALGRRLLVHADRGDHAWAHENFTPHLWDTRAGDRAHRLTAENFGDVLYASTRLLHAWQRPAEVEGVPFVDAIYTCAIPVLEVSTMDYREIIAIVSDPGPIYRNIFRSSVIQETAWRAAVHIIRPGIAPKSFGVEETTASEQGLINLYDHGLDQGLRFIGTHLETINTVRQGWDWPKRIDSH